MVSQEVIALLFGRIIPLPIEVQEAVSTADLQWNLSGRAVQTETTTSFGRFTWIASELETDARTSAIVSASRGYNSPEDKNDETIDNKFSAASFRLRRLRKIIYDKATLNSDADKDLKKYSLKVRKFVKNFRENLTKKLKFGKIKSEELSQM